MVAMPDLNVTCKEFRLTRRDFLKLCGVSSYGLILAACDVTPTPTPTSVPTQTLTITPTPTKTATPTIRPSETPTPTSTVGVRTETWATDNNGVIIKGLMANVVNKALIEDKYAFDLYFGSLKLAIVEDEGLSQANSQLLNEIRNQAKAELEGEQGKKCISQLLRALKELRANELDLSDCTAIIERNFEGVLQVTSIIVVENNNPRLFRFQPDGEIVEAEIFPMFPDLKVEERNFFWPTQMSYDWLPPIRDDSRTTIVEDPTGIIGGKVFKSEILSEYNNGSYGDNDRHRPYYPGPNRDPFNPPHGSEKDDTGWNLPIVMEATIYFDEIQSDIGINVHALGERVAGEGYQVYAMGGDYHSPWPGIPPNYEADAPSTNTLLAQREGKWYILPMSFNTKPDLYGGAVIGSFVDLNASFPLKQWVEFKTISAKNGIWTLMRLHGQNRYRVMGYVEQYNLDVPGFSANFGPYALPSVSSFRAYQKDLTVASWGDVVYFPPGGPRP